MPTYHGKCHCGAVEWEVQSDNDQKHILCHCGACKIIGGGEYTLNLVIPKKNFKITKGENHIGKYSYKGDSGNETHCYYCKTCTSHPYHDQTVNENAYVIRSSLLREGKDLALDLEIYARDRWSWQPATAPKDFPTVP